MIPASECSFVASSCELVKTIGSTTSQGTKSSFVTVVYPGTGSTASITFTINTAT